MGSYAILDPERIKAFSEERGLERAELAEAAGISMDTLRRIERGERVRFGTGWKVGLPLGVHPQEIGTPIFSAHMRKVLSPWLSERGELADEG